MREDLEEFSHYKRSSGRRGIPFLLKTSKNGKCHVHWSDGTLSDYDVFQRIFKGPLGKHMDSQLKDYFDTLSSRSKAEFDRGGYAGYFGPIDCAMASDVFSVVAFHFKTALEWMAESEIKDGWTEEKWEAQVEYIDKKNAEFGKHNGIEVEQQQTHAEKTEWSDEEYPSVVSEYESEMRDGIQVMDSAPWDPGQSEHEPAAPEQPDIQQLTYRIFELIEPAIKAAIAQAIQEHFES